MKCWGTLPHDLQAYRNVSRTRPQSSRGPPPAPPLQDIPPPPPPPPPGSDGGGPPQKVFWTRRNIFATLLVGSGLWYWRNYDALDPHVTFISRDSTPDGMQLMVSPTGEPYGITLIPTKTGDFHMLMLDAYGNMYYDPNDRSLGIYIVRWPSTVVLLCSCRCHAWVLSSGMLYAEPGWGRSMAANCMAAPASGSCQAHALCVALSVANQSRRALAGRPRCQSCQCICITNDTRQG